MEGETDPDQVPEPPPDPVTKPGDLIELGDHRLLCGDSTKREDVDRVLGGERPATTCSDPPYGVEYVGKTKDALTVRNDGAAGLRQLLTDSLGHAFDVCLEGAVWYVAAPAGPQFEDFAAVLSKLGVWRQTLVWVKDSMVLGRSDYHYRHEAIFYGWKPGKAHREPPDRTQTTVWEVPRPKASREHPTMKPVALYARMLKNSTTVGSVVYEPFCGSGTTLIAAEQLGRRCYGIEIDPGYCDVVVARWEAFTGRKVERLR
jgi:site-specific DNA-methyltransferase (adenine-specific)